MPIPIDPVPPPWGDDMEEAWKAQHKALQQQRETGRAAVKRGWSTRRAMKISLATGLLILFLYSAFSGDL